MSFIAAKCTQCGGKIIVDDTKEAGICKFCGTAFVTEKVINNYNTYNNISNNFAGANVTLNYSNQKSADWYYNTLLELRKKQARMLLLDKVGDTYDFQKIRNTIDSLMGEYRKQYPLDERIDIIESASGIYFDVDSVFKDSECYVGKNNESSFNNALKSILHNEYSISLGTHGWGWVICERIFEEWDKIDKIRIPEIKEMAIEYFEKRYEDRISKSIANIEVFREGEIKEYGRYGFIFSEINLIKDEKTGRVIGIYYDTKSDESKGCYVATCVYGSYDCPEVWVLRRFRDYCLAETWYGRAFIKTYYAISPTIVKWFGNTKWFKDMWRGTLTRMVKHLKDIGYESTPYSD